MRSALLLLLLLLVLPLRVGAQSPSPTPATPPTTTPENIGSTSKGTQIEQGWNYFKVDSSACSLRQVFNELQADGGGALEASELWRLEGQSWKKYVYGTSTADNLKVGKDDLFAFNSNQRAFFDIAPDACVREDEARTQQIEAIRDASQASSESNFLSRLLSVPRDVWTGLLDGLGFGREPALPPSDYKADSALFKTLNVLGESTIGELKITGKLTVGTLWLDGLGGSLNNLGTLKIQDKIGGNIEFLGGAATLDSNGNFRLEGGLILDSRGAKPACEASSRGKLWFTKRETGDLVEICVRDSSGRFLWRAL